MKHKKSIETGTISKNSKYERRMLKLKEIFPLKNDKCADVCIKNII